MSWRLLYLHTSDLHAFLFSPAITSASDYQNEFFFDANTQKLYFFYNGTGAPPSDMQWVVPMTKILFNV